MVKFSHFYLGILVIVLLIISFSSYNLWRTSKHIINQQTSSELVGWGLNEFGQIAVSNEPTNFLSKPTAVLFDKPVEKFALGYEHTLALTRDGELWTWGNNRYGQLGIGNTSIYQAKPVKVEGIGEVKDIAAKLNHSVALDSKGQVWTWGLNYSGQLGDGTNQDKSHPVLVEGLNDVKKVVAGYRFSLAIKEDGTVWAWGASCSSEDISEMQSVIEEVGGSFSSLGGYFNPYTSDFLDRELISDCANEESVAIQSKIPKQLEGFDDIVDADAGFGHIIALDSEGRVWTRGCNTYGQLGLGMIGNPGSRVPQYIEILPKVKQISAGFRHSVVVDKDGNVWTWGYLPTKELEEEHLTEELASEFSKPNPQKVNNISDVLEISAGHDLTIALDKNKKLYGWGINVHPALLGEGVPVVAEPFVVSSDFGWQKIYLGGSHILATNDL